MAKLNAGGIESNRMKKAALYRSIPCGSSNISGANREN
jgi:hypothetical protein